MNTEDKLDRILSGLADLRASFHAHKESVDKQLESGRAHRREHDTRLRAVERRQSWFLGMGAALGAIGTALLKKAGW